MADDWQLATLGDAIDLNPQVKLDRDVVYPFVDMAALDPGRRSVGPSEDRVYKGSGSRFAHGDTLFARITPCLENGKICRYSAPELAASVAHGSTEFIVLRGKPGITDSGFVYYLSRSDDLRTFAVGQMNGSSGRQRVPVTSLASYPFLLPPYEDQLVIASILGALDDKIELNRRMAQTLEEMARALFKSWFVDFDPVRAKAEGRDPGLPKHLADLFPDRLVNSELGEIPEGWDAVTLDDHVRCVKGRSYKSSELVDRASTAMVTLKSFERGGGYRPEGLKPFSGAYKPEQVLSPGELVIACTDVTQDAEVVGRPAIVRNTEKASVLVASLDAMVVRPCSNRVSTPFLYYLALSNDFTAHMYAHTSGTTVLHLARDAVPSFRLALPPVEIVRSFDALAAAALERIDALFAESDTLTRVRGSLLPLLISGKLRLPDPEGLLTRLEAVT